MSASAKKSPARERILETAGRLFHERGYSCVGINEIIKESGTAKATFYDHFPSKTDLCVAWLDALHARSEERCQKILNDPCCSIKKVDAYFANLGAFMKASQFRGCPYSNTGAVTDTERAEIARQIQTHKMASRKFFRELAGSIAACSSRAETLGDALFLLYSGATTEAQNLKSQWPVDAARAVAHELCLCASEE